MCDYSLDLNLTNLKTVQGTIMTHDGTIMYGEGRRVNYEHNNIRISYLRIIRNHKHIDDALSHNIMYV